MTLILAPLKPPAPRLAEAFLKHVPRPDPLLYQL